MKNYNPCVKIKYMKFWLVSWEVGRENRGRRIWTIMVLRVLFSVNTKASTTLPETPFSFATFAFFL